MKTNHQRRYRANKQPRDQSMLSRSKKLHTKAVAAGIGNDFTNGHRGMARAKAGLKKYLRVQERVDGKRLCRVLE